MKAIRPILAFILLLAALSAAAQKPAPPVTNINRVKPPASLPKTVLDGGLTLTNVGDRAAFALELGVMASGASVTLLNGATGALTLTTRAGYGITDALSLDSDLTAIAALSTAGLGRSLLTLADAAAGRAAIGAGVSKFNGSFAAPTGLPTTLAGLGTTDTVAGGHGTRMVADNDARDEATPDFVGQLLIQSDVGAIFRGTALTAGAWSYGFLLHNSTGAVPVQLSLGANSLGGFLNGAARWSIDNSTGAASFASIFGPLTGNATSATALAAGNTINGVNFTGAAPITVPAAAGTLTGGALAAGVTSAPGLLAASGGPFGAGAFITAQPAYTVFGNATGSTSAPVFANTLTLSDAVRKTVAITAISAGTPATFTAPGHTFVVGEKIIMCGLNGAAGQSDTSGNFAFNSFFGMTVTAKTATTFQTNATVPGGTAQGGLTHAFAGLTNAAQAIIQGNADVYGSTKGNLLLRVANANVNDQGTGIVLEATDHSSPPTLWTNWLFGAQNGLQIGPGLTVLNGGVMGYGLAVFNTNDTATTVSPGGATRLTIGTASIAGTVPLGIATTVDADAANNGTINLAGSGNSINVGISFRPTNSGGGNPGTTWIKAATNGNMYCGPSWNILSSGTVGAGALLAGFDNTAIALNRATTVNAGLTVAAGHALTLSGVALTGGTAGVIVVQGGPLGTPGSGTLGAGVTIQLSNVAFTGTHSGSLISGGTFGAVNGSALTGLSKAQVGLGSVENTALSTWAGSANVTALGTISEGGRRDRSAFESWYLPCSSVQATGDFLGVTSGGTNANYTTPVAGHPGVIQQSTGATSTGRAAYALQNLSAILLGGGAAHWESCAAVVALSDATDPFTYRAGFINSNVGESTDGVFSATRTPKTPATGAASAAGPARRLPPT